jgi:molybdopterin synthase catalytic subunit
MFMLSDQPIDPHALRQQLFADDCGGFVSFEGWVRNHHAGKAVKGLRYQAYPELALHTGQHIVEQALQQFAITKAACVHRVGELSIGDVAVWVGVSSAHRDAAFAACRFIIDTVKADVAIWKEEYYVHTEPPQWLANAESR